VERRESNNRGGKRVDQAVKVGSSLLVLCCCVGSASDVCHHAKICR
jgi:hypothetical protein